MADTEAEVRRLREEVRRLYAEMEALVRRAEEAERRPNGGEAEGGLPGCPLCSEPLEGELWVCEYNASHATHARCMKKEARKALARATR